MNLQLSGKNHMEIDIMLNCQEIQNMFKEFSLQGLEISNNSVCSGNNAC